MLFRSVLDREVGRRRRNADPNQRYPLTSLLDCYQCVRHDEHVSYGNLGVPVPPFGVAFSTARGLQSVLAVANEEGVVRLYNTESRENPVLKEWMAHENAVFDIAWVPGEASLVTASGDQMAKLWDVKSGELLGCFKGHQCSLKSVAFTKQEKAVFCSGGRDGNIMVWDTRCSKKDGFYRQVKQISGAHNKADKITPSKVKKRRPGTRGMAPSVDSQQSVTVVLFRDEHTLVSSGAVDGIIKVWDLRKNYTAHHHNPEPLQKYLYPGSSTRKIGYSGLVLDSTGSNLFSSCIDNNIYMFNISGLKTTPVAVFAGHLNSSFYIKSTVSPDDQFLASGSSDHQAYIWNISDPSHPPMTLQGHSQEVTTVTWCPSDFTKIASCSDDNTVRIWRLDRGMDGQRSSVGEANLVGWACAKLTTNVLSPTVSTPTQSPRTKSLGGLASPQLAACAPNGAALPLPSSTTSPIQARDVRPPQHRTPPTIKQWFSPIPGSPSDQVSPLPRRVLNPFPQSPVRTASPSERRVKRRLETGNDASGSSDAAQHCDCVTELFPTAKRSRTLVGVCCSNKDQPQRVESCKDAPIETDSYVDNNKQTTSTQTEKENCSPGAVDWLSVMGQRQKKTRGGPSRPRSPNASKKQEGKTPASPTICSPQTMKKISSYFQRRTLE
ncbi:denticleless protein homolog [Lampris incognitus]|uniref:denticleless protein homolog n=1 Tax=Lampris incognitus TaxID=2546036 RepID=UPI0024B48887|nr:denticleless protein homolog [Lampris incognitus]